MQVGPQTNFGRGGTPAKNGSHGTGKAVIIEWEPGI